MAKRATQSGLPRNGSKTVTLLLALSLQSFSAEAGENRIYACKLQTDSSQPTIQCEIDVSDGSTIVSYSVSNITDNKPIVAEFLASGGSESSSTVVEILLDQGGALEKPDFNRLKDVATSILDPEAKFVFYGLSTFSTNVEQKAPIGAPPKMTQALLRGIGASGGRTLELLRSVNEVSKEIIATPSRRKILVILSEGNFADPAYTVPEVIKGLREAGVRVYAVIPGKAPEEVTEAQSLRRLSEETDGEFMSAYDRKSAEWVVKVIKSHIRNGGYVKFAPVENPVRVEVVLSSNKRLTRTYEPPPPPPPSPLQPRGAETEASPPATDMATKLWSLEWLWKDRVGQAMLAAGTLLVVFLTVLTWRWRRQIRHARDSAEPHSPTERVATVGDLKPPLAWFEFLDANETKEPIYTAVTRIGRQHDNDLILHNTTVHRHHALLRQEPTGTFVIMDLDTINKVKLNGDTVKSAPLCDGDIVELGEVRMRFRAA